MKTVSWKLLKQPEGVWALTIVDGLRYSTKMYRNREDALERLSDYFDELIEAERTAEVDEEKDPLEETKRIFGITEERAAKIDKIVAKIQESATAADSQEKE